METQHTACTLIRSGETYAGKQDLSYFSGISAESAGAQALCLHLVTIPPGGRARAHLHEHHESAVYVLTGAVEVWHGEELREHMVAQTGDFIYIPAGVLHLPINLSKTKPCTAVIARTDPHEQASVLILVEFDVMY